MDYRTAWFAVEYRGADTEDYQVTPRFLTVEKEMVPLTPILLKGQLYTYYHYVVYLKLPTAMFALHVVIFYNVFGFKFLPLARSR